MSQVPDPSTSSPVPAAITPPAPAGPALIDYEDFAKLDLRTAKILDVREHPNADKLYLLQVQVGTETKQIVAGVRAFLTKEDLLGKTIVIVHNLKPAKLRGEMSNGMMLAVRKEDGGLSVLTTSSPTSDGLKVS